MKTDRPDHSSPSIAPGSGPTPKLPPPPSAAGSMGSGLGATSSFPEEFNVHNIPPAFKKEGNDWFAIFNPKVKKVLDVTLAHTLMHERCVRALSREWMAKLFLLFPIVSCAASGSRRMENIWQRAATVRRKYMTQRLVRKLG
jgi:hypothetical protein